MAPIAAKPAQPVTPCSGAAPVNASMSSRAAKPLTAVEECGLRPMDVFRECDKCPEMVMVPAGSFVMGANDAKQQPIAGPPHQVTIAKPFAVGRFHITVAEFTAFVGETGYEAGPCMIGESWRNPGFPQSGNHPVVCVNWADAKAYIVWLATRTGKAYRLLSEAEWEYAARAGTTTEWFWGDKGADAKTYAHCFDCSGGTKFAAATAPVGSLKPNKFGLYDMAGNASQLVQDCYQPGYNGAPTDGSAWTSGTCPLRVIRGGSWQQTLDWVRSAGRFLEAPNTRTNEVGFRVARTLNH
jgi:formylglycine-generating enzyme required for sulfatase activity